MSARDDYPFIARWERTAYEQTDRRQCAAALDRIDALEAQLERTRAEYAAAITRIAEPQLTVEACDRILEAMKDEGL